MKRRSFLAGTIGAGMVASSDARALAGAAKRSQRLPATVKCEPSSRPVFGGSYEGANADCIGFPIGGMGAGMICLDGNGSLSKFSLRHRPDLVSEHTVFAALSMVHPERRARVLECAVPRWKLQPKFSDTDSMGVRSCLGLPRFRHNTFESRFPFAAVRLNDDAIPVQVVVTGWSPFSPGDADSASLPVAALEYQFTNHSAMVVDAVFSFNTTNFMALPVDVSSTAPAPVDRIRATQRGFVLYGSGPSSESLDEGHCAIWIDDPAAKIDHAWFRGSRPDWRSTQRAHGRRDPSYINKDSVADQ